MYPRRMASPLSLLKARKQSGFLLPLALFVIVGVAALGIAISRIVGQSAVDRTQSAINLAAFYAAESGAQFAMNQLFYSTTVGITRATQTSNCGTIDGSSVDFTNDGLNGCSAALSCGASTDAGDTTSFFVITSVGQCGSGEINASRTVQVTSFLGGEP